MKKFEEYLAGKRYIGLAHHEILALVAQIIF
jgi:hypothetical protein